MNTNVVMQKLVLIAPLVARTVLYLLIGLSVLSIGVIIERWWFFRFLGETPDPIYFSEERHNDDFDALDSASPAEVLASWDAEVDRIRRDIATIPLDTEFTGRRGTAYSLRWVYLHMIEEYARHNGHADLVREGIDGVSGE